MSSLSRFVLFGNLVSIFEVTVLFALPILSAFLFSFLQENIGHDLSLFVAGGFAVVAGIASVTIGRTLALFEDELAEAAARSKHRI